MKKTLINLGLFQLGWLVCVLAGNAYAGAYTLLALLLHQWLVLDDRREWRLIFGVALVGCLWDIALAQSGVIRYGNGILAGIPPWLLCLWLLFATTFMHCLRWLHGMSLLAAALAATLGPASYWFGTQLTDAELRTPLPGSLVIMAVGWAMLFPLGLAYAANLKTSAGHLNENTA